MDVNHWLLAFLWIVYCASHSVLAAVRVKLFFERISGGFFRYYRLAYTIWATITLILIIYFQYSFSSIAVINTSGLAIQYVSWAFFICPGLVIMLIAIVKYFKLLSGVRTLYEPRPTVTLQVAGIHNYVRHPLYLGTLLFIWGLFLIFPLLNNLIAVIIISGYVLIGIPIEEKKLLNEFGSSYAEYISNVPMLLPHFRKAKQNKKGQPSGCP